MDTSSLFDAVVAPDVASQEAVLNALADARPVGAGLGRLGEVAAWISSCQGQVPPQPLARPRMIVFAGDHGIAAREVSALPAEASAQRAQRILEGSGPVNVLARSAGASISLVDVSLDHEAWGEQRVSRSSGAIDVEDAMSLEQFDRALDIGRAIADREVDSGADLLIPAELGVGSSTIAATIIGAFTRTEPVVVVGTGVGMSDQLWKNKVCVIRDAMFRVRTLLAEPTEVLRKASSPDFVALVGFLAQAAIRRTPVLLDGAAVSVAAYVAERLAPGARDWFWAGQLTPEPAQLIALQALELTPLLALDINAGQGVGALAALPLISAAAELVAEELSPA
ncbi:nicotinate-nucleotide--dimethylbenzimidazole phosphoribosyltransferase [Corynebacterium alimapuense]|uniref:Nicotinate-nucleotide--dimethylbenzimidazole phosphoribosyltransferase n=1 Tax=Corynebacterium alimapuense TaxID=1576874 RepID=A0A3M8KAN1_9CORY|nr:nicotinate-nucleotide--dimethylbenzimidazole phosphoribosyltransferase [Corynebacterium alimapuense]RNE49518.1 nicotinate-nucleotide--dimethylbenzimidazole phosphoribosyltransferase [Corynebacterium alimapuense]